MKLTPKKYWPPVLWGCMAWLAAAALPAQAMDHKAFDEVLHAYVSAGQVNYSGVADDPHFPAYLEELKRTDADALPSREEKLAFWMNAYNAFAMKGILDGYSPNSVFGKVRYFYLNKYDVGGKTINLYNMEHEIIRPLNEPRIHFSIVCASRSCPKQRSDAYTAQRLEQQLDENARGFINDVSRNRFDRNEKIAHLSMIFKWFDEDFSKNSGSVLKYISNYVSDSGLASELELGSYTIKYLEYDWNLNGTPPPGK
ncbi:MAG: DUF547 domain-containing protein [Burkholderiales bacterium]